MDGNNIDNNMICCFCGKTLKKEIATLIQIIPKINDVESQDLYCHKKCLIERLDKSIPIHPNLLKEV